MTRSEITEAVEAHVPKEARTSVLKYVFLMISCDCKIINIDRITVYFKDRHDNERTIPLSYIIGDLQ